MRPLRPRAQLRRLVTVVAQGYRRRKPINGGGRSMPSLRVLLAGCCTLALAAPASAASAPEYYRGKRLSVLINFAAGGPTDIEGRLFARHLAKHIPGKPTVIVQNMSGAGGLVGAQYLGEVAPKDGTMLGYLSGTTWIYVSDPKRFRVDFRSYEFVAYQPGTTVHFVRTDVPPGMTKPADIVKAKGLVAGGLTADTSKDLRMRMGLDMLGVPYKYVTGYNSSPPARLALQRNEIHMFSESPPSYRAVVVPNLVQTGQAIGVWWDDIQETAPKQKQMEGLTLPTFPELYRQVKGKMPSGQMWEAYKVLFDINSKLQRLVVLPPGAPKAAYEALRIAIERLNDDNEFAADAMKTIQFVPDYPTAPDMSSQVRAMLVATPEMRDYINHYTKNPPKR
jgi:tripartite-type tricarboxylate transporter receptor subunit TctC